MAVICLSTIREEKKLKRVTLKVGYHRLAKTLRLARMLGFRPLDSSAKQDVLEVIEELSQIYKEI